MTNDSRDWLRTLQRRPDARFRLFLIPHAGGGPAFFRDWPKAFPADIELVAVQAPGREARLSHPPLREMAPFTAALADAIGQCDERPFAIFGHSLGALIAFETSRLLCLRGAAPVALVVSGARAPRFTADRPILSALSDDGLRQEIARMGGTPPAVLDNDEYFQLMLPTLRADLEVFEKYRPSDSSPLAVTVLAVGGQTDASASLSELMAWREVTNGPFECRTLPGGHFYLTSRQSTLAAAIHRVWVGAESTRFAIAEEHVDLWLLPLDGDGPDHCLSDAERERAARFLKPEHRRRFATCRMMMRTILGRYLDVDPAKIPFSIGSHGKPAVPSLEFNLSHSGEIGVLAIGRHELGVDIETIRDDVDFMGLAERFLAPAEKDRLLATAQNDRRDLFFAIWAGKEAYCKARGLGLQLPTDQYAVMPAHSAPWPVDDASVAEAERPRVFPLFVKPGFASAMASAKGVSTIRVRGWKEEIAADDYG